MIHAFTAIVLATSSLTSLVQLSSGGDWPATWPKEFEPFRRQARTAWPMTGGPIENWYQISFKNREEFEQLWPAIVKLMDRGSEIHAQPTGLTREYFGDSDWGYSAPVVRIFAAPDQPYGFYPMIDQDGKHISSELRELHYRSLRKEPLSAEQQKKLDGASFKEPRSLDMEAMKVNNGRWVRSGPPWPDDVRNEKGELPELVHWDDVDGVIRWIAGPWKTNRENGIRCRIDVELVVDGKIIDLERIQVPDYMKLLDYRLNPAQPVVRP